MREENQAGTNADCSKPAGARAILTDSHFLIPLAVFCVGLALLITLH